MALRAVFILFAMFVLIAGCVVTFRTKAQKTSEREVQLGVAGPKSEYTKSQINTVDQIRDTSVTVNVKKDTTIHTKVTKDTISNYNIHHD